MKYVDIITNKDTKVSEVILEHKGKQYSGHAICHPEDYWSNFFGCEIAELRAYIKVLKDKIKTKRTECETIKKFISTIASYKAFNCTSEVAKAMDKQMNIKFKELDILLEKLEKTQNQIETLIKERDKFFAKQKEKK